MSYSHFVAKVLALVTKSNCDKVTNISPLSCRVVDTAILLASQLTNHLYLHIHTQRKIHYKPNPRHCPHQKSVLLLTPQRDSTAHPNRNLKFEFQTKKKRKQRKEEEEE